MMRLYRRTRLSLGSILVAALLGSILCITAPSALAADPIPPTNNTSAPYLCWYGWALDSSIPGEGMPHLATAASWLYRSNLWAEDFNASDSWANISSAWPSKRAAAWLRSNPGTYISTVPMLPPGCTLASGSSGAYNSYFATLAQNIVNEGIADRTIIRLGHEFNGTWYVWKVSTQADAFAFAEYFRQIVTTMRSVPGAENLRFCWNGSNVWNSYSLADAYPGDAYVDYIGVDIYDQSWDSNTYPYPTGASDVQKLTRQQNAWTSISGTNNAGLAWWRNFAAAHQKPMAIPEWGLCSRSDGHGGLDNPYFIQQMYAFIHDPANNVAWHVYFDVTAGDGDHLITQLPGAAGTQFPKAAALFRKLFGMKPFLMDADIGAVGLSGSSDPVSVYGAGNGYQVSGTSDSFHYATRSIIGDDMEIVQIMAVSSASMQSGLMFRENLEPGSAYAALSIVDGQCVFQSRSVTGAAAVQDLVTASIKAPVWLKLLRRGNQITGYQSADGRNWTYAGGQTLAVSGDAYLGVAVSSRTTGAIGEASIDHVGDAGIAAVDPSMVNATIIDASSTAQSGVVKTGSWTGSTNAACYGGDQLINWAPNTPSSLKFTPTIPSTGLYDVYLRWWGGASYQFADSMPVSITSLDGTASGLVNQKTANYLWNYLGTYQFAAGTAGNLVLSNSGCQGFENGYIRADAVMFVPVPVSGTAPVTPAFLSATGSNAVVNLGWTPSDGATAYAIKRSITSGSGYATIATVSGASYSDTAVVNGVSYFYLVSAFNASGQGPDSAEAVGTPLGPPPAPGNVTGTAGYGDVALSWTASPGATSYNVKRSTSSNSGFVMIGTTLGTSYTDTSAVNGTTYYYIVSAVNSYGEGPGSAPVSATPTAGSPPATPTGLNATARNATVALTWKSSASATSYNIKRSTTGSADWITVGTSSTNSYTDNSVSNGIVYYYAVSAVSSAGESADSSPVMAAPTLNGNMPAGWMDYDIGNPSPAGWATYDQGVFTVKGGGANIYYTSDQFNLASKTISGDQTIIARVTGMTNTDASAKTGVMFRTSTAASSGFVMLAVKPAGGIAFFYRASAGGSAVSSASGTAGVTPSATTPVWLKLVKSGTSFTAFYAVSVAVPSSWMPVGVAINVNLGSGSYQLGLGVCSNNNGTLATATLDYVSIVSPSAPAVPTGLTAMPGDSTVTLTWNASAGAKGYVVKRASASGGPYDPIDSPAGTSSVDLTAINGKTYYYVVSSVNDLGESLDSPEVSATPVAPPDAPATVSVTPGNASVLVTWTPSANATSYRIERSDESSSGFVTIAISSISRYIDTAAANGITHYYRISATNGSGESAGAPAVAGTPVAGPLPAGWTAADIGGPSPAGSSVASSGVYTVKGSGANIYYTSDQYQYLSQTLTGDQTLVARVTGLTNTNANAKAGVMFRASSASNAGFVMVDVKPAGGIEFIYRKSTGGSAVYSSGTTTGLTPSASTPIWVRLVKSGTSYSAFYSLGGETWIQIGSSVDASLGSGQFLGGIAVCSVNAGSMATATFDNVSLPNASAPAIPTGLAAMKNDLAITLSWNASSGAIGYEILRSNSSGSEVGLIGTAVNCGFTDTTAAAGTSYRYAVRAVNGVGASAASGSVSVTANMTFAQWASANYLPADGTAIPHNDGIPNLLKYLCHVDPSRAVNTSDRAALPHSSLVQEGGTDYITLTFRQNALATGLSVQVEKSSDLKTWVIVTPDLWDQISTDEATGDPIMRIGVNRTGSPGCFIRLRVTGP